MRRGGTNKKNATATVTTATNDAPVDDAAKATDADIGTTKSNSTAVAIAPTAIYETSIRAIRQVHTVEEFWETYDFLKRPNELSSASPPNIDYHFFRVLKNNATGQYVPIKPTWEDVRFYCCCC
jgi:hypothetical protein